MGVFICFSVILLFNFFGLQILADPPESLRNYSFDDNGLFKSIFLNDYILVGLVGGLSSLFSIYFAISRWSYRWLLMSFACSILVFVNLKRSVILAFLVSIFVVFIIEFFQLRISKRKLNAGFFVCLLITVFGFFAYYTSPIVLFSSDYITSRFATFGSFDSVFYSPRYTFTRDRSYIPLFSLWRWQRYAAILYAKRNSQWVFFLQTVLFRKDIFELFMGP